MIKIHRNFEGQVRQIDVSWLAIFGIATIITLSVTAVKLLTT